MYEIICTYVYINVYIFIYISSDIYTLYIYALLKQIYAYIGIICGKY
jgi:hypothetical protein